MKAKKQFWDSYARKYDRFIDRYAGSTYKEIKGSILNETCSEDNVLEIGTGTGIIACEIASRVKSIVATDISIEMIKHANAKLANSDIDNLQFHMGSAYLISYPDKYFDIAIASNVFHLLSYPEKALKEISRVLKESGKLIIPTYCHGESIIARLISLIMGISGFTVENRWSTDQYRMFVESLNFNILSEKIIKDKIPMSVIVANKQTSHE